MWKFTSTRPVAPALTRVDRRTYRLTFFFVVEENVLIQFDLAGINKCYLGLYVKYPDIFARF